MIFTLVFGRVLPYNFKTYSEQKCVCCKMLNSIPALNFREHVRDCELRPSVSRTVESEILESYSSELEHKVHVGLMKLANDCWNLDPTERPTIINVWDQLRVSCIKLWGKYTIISKKWVFSESVYEGPCKVFENSDYKIPHGVGKRTFSKGSQWISEEGTFVDGLLQGNDCKIIYAGGTTYEGGMKNGKRNGFGIKKFGGVTWKGIWENGTLSSGEITNANGVYNGELQDVNGNGNFFPFGIGTMKYKSGHVYAGKWISVVQPGDFITRFRNGFGTMKYPSGKVQSGMWEMSKFIGESQKGTSQEKH